MLDTSQAPARRDWQRRCRENALDGEDRAFIDARLKALEHQIKEREGPRPVHDRLKDAHSKFAREEDRLKRNVLAVESAEQSLIAAKVKHAEAQQELHAVQQENKLWQRAWAIALTACAPVAVHFSCTGEQQSRPVCDPTRAGGGASTDSRGIVLSTLFHWTNKRSRTRKRLPHRDECWVTVTGKPAVKMGGYTPIRPYGDTPVPRRSATSNTIDQTDALNQALPSTDESEDCR